MQDAGPKLADPNWRAPPEVVPEFGPAASGELPEATPPSTPGQFAPGSPGGLPNGHAHEPSFRFGLPEAKFLSFAGPGGDAFAKGEPELFACSQLSCLNLILFSPIPSDVQDPSLSCCPLS